MGSWRDSIPSKWLKAKDLDEKPHLVTIKKFTVEDFGDKKGPCVWFQELEKGLGLNITNGNRIEKIAGTADPQKWLGKRIVIFPTETEFKGEMVECIRVRAPKAGAKLPPPPAEPEGDVADEEQHEGYEPTDDDVPF